MSAWLLFWDEIAVQLRIMMYVTSAGISSTSKRWFYIYIYIYIYGNMTEKSAMVTEESKIALNGKLI